MSELKPCPFCGGRAELTTNGRGFPNEEWVYFWVSCSECEITTTGKDTAQKAVDLWNRRFSKGESKCE